MFHVVLAYKNLAASSAISHIGLGVAALNTAKVLNRDGILTEVWAIDTPKDLESRLDKAQSSNHPITHLVMSAPWIPTLEWQRLCIRFNRIRFACSSHSNVGFLQADPMATKFMTSDGLHLERGFLNFSLAANSEALCRFIRAGYSAPCQYLPNLYFLEDHTRCHRPQWISGELRIGCFGAVRVLKNHISAAAAAIEIAANLRATLAFYISGGRNDGQGGTALVTLRQIIRSCKFASLVEISWEQWPEFRQTVSHMHLLMQPSYTESFNMVTADGVAEGVASVVSSAVDWVPQHWMADADDVGDIARVGSNLLRDHNAPQDGFNSLSAYVDSGLRVWKNWLHRTRPVGV